MKRMTLTTVSFLFVAALAALPITHAASSASVPLGTSTCQGCLTAVPLEIDSDGDPFVGIDLRIGFDSKVAAPTDVLLSAITSDCRIEWTSTSGRTDELAIEISCFSRRSAAGPVAYVLFEGVGKVDISPLSWQAAKLNGHPVDFTRNGSMRALAEASTLRMLSVDGQTGTSVDLPLVGDLEPGSIGINAEVHWDPAVLSGVSMTLAPGLPADCFLTSIFPMPGEARIAVACITPLSGVTPLVDITVDVVGAAGTVTALDLVTGAVNEIDAELEDGLFTAVSGTGVEVSVPTKTFVCEGESVGVPISICPVDGVIGMDFELAYDPALVVPTDVLLVDLGLGCLLDWNVSVPGELAIAISCVTPQSGCGEVANIVFDSIGPGPATSALTWLRQDLNENTIPSTPVDGEICITPPGEFLALPSGASGVTGTTVMVPLSGDLPPGSIGINATVNWDPAVLTALAVDTDPGLPGDWIIDTDLSTPGTALISLFGTTPIGGAVALANLEFDVLGAVGETSPLEISSGQVNEVPVCLVDGMFTVSGPECGDGIVDPGEQCDDGNTADGDGCSSTCQIEGGPNLVKNGNFTRSLPWRYSHSDGNSTYSIVNDEACIDIVTPSTDGQLWQSGIILQPNTTYRFTFDGRNTGGDNVRARVIRHTSPYTQYGSQVINLTTTMQTYTFTFTTPALVHEARVQFYIGRYDSAGDDYYFDNVILAVDSPAVCGNGTVEAGEQCDDGNTNNGDGCDSTCQNEPVCGNGTVEAGEQCDDGNTSNGDGCDSTCQLEPPVCGNGIVEAGEQCDDGNTVDGDGCSSTCQSEGGPNLVINGNFSGTLPWHYTHSDGSSTYSIVNDEACIDIVTPSTNGQLWQDGITLQPNTTYRLTFDGRNTGGDSVRARVIRHTSPYTQYGSRVINLTTTMQTYTFTFTTPALVHEARVQFYIGPYDSAGDDYYFDNVILAVDSPAVCGNGIVEGGEQCDDGNTNNGDGCDSTCQNEPVCGNGTVEAGEQCDDGNTSNGDGCDSTCQLEPPVCGNGIVEAGEQCDDGNTVDGDGCSSTCQNEGGPNLVINGNFSGTLPWRYTHSNGSSTYSVVGGEAFIDIATPSTDGQLWQNGITLQPNTTYRVTFRARNTAGNNVRASVIRHSSPYTQYGRKVIILTATMETYTFTFTTPATVAEARMQFYIGPYDEANGDYYFDDVVLEVD